MRYPNYDIKGPINLEQKLRIDYALHVLGCIRGIPEEQFYFDGIRHQLLPGFSPIPAIDVTPDEFFTKLIELEEQVNNFINSLVPGSKVVVCKCDTTPDDYPCYFCNDMHTFEGREVTISGVKVSDTYLGKGKRFYNHSNVAYHIVEDCGQFFWHSSMFELQDIQSIEKLIISELNVNPLIIK